MSTDLLNIHGGDIYRNDIELDFSVNINPLGMPEDVRKALIRSVDDMSSYPDIFSEDLKKTVGLSMGIDEEQLIFGNGASELFMAIVHGSRPKKILIPVPSYYGYEYAAKACGAEIRYHYLDKDKGFLVEKSLTKALTEDINLMFIANPNNPTGRLIDKDILTGIIRDAEEKGIVTVIDESFLDFCGLKSLSSDPLTVYENIIVVRTFTKIFAIPGVRLGYMVIKDPVLRQRIKMQIPEWNISGMAQAAGKALQGQDKYIRDTVALITKERSQMAEALRALGLKVFPGSADYILFYSDVPLYKKLLKRRILIRDCGNFRGLSEGYYRTAVKTKNDNCILIKNIREILNEY